MPSVTYLRLSDVSVIFRVTYLQFPSQACFSSTSVSQAAQQRTWFTQYQTSYVAKNLGRLLVQSKQALFGKTTLTVKFSELCSTSLQLFIATLIYVLCSNFVKFGRRKISEIVRCLPDKTKTISPGSPAIAPGS